MSIEDRIARLERENRRLKVAVLLVLAVIGSVFVMGQARPATAPPVSSSFTVVNTNGVDVGQLSTRTDGHAQIIFNDPADGSPGPFRVLGVGPEYGGGALLELGSRKTAEYRQVIVFRTPATGVPTVKAYDENGVVVWSLP